MRPGDPASSSLHRDPRLPGVRADGDCGKTIISRDARSTIRILGVRRRHDRYSRGVWPSSMIHDPARLAYLGAPAISPWSSEIGPRSSLRR